MTRSRRVKEPVPEPDTYEVGTWAGHRNFGCPFCPYRTLEGTAHVVAHIASDHRDQAITQAQEALT